MSTNTKINEPIDLLNLIKNTKCVVIKFSASWCGPCQNAVFKQEYADIKKKYLGNTNIQFIELDIDDDADIINDKTYYNFNVKSIPHFKISLNGNIELVFDGNKLKEIKEYLENIY